jgi:signal transduction histidine kinase
MDNQAVYGLGATLAARADLRARDRGRLPGLVAIGVAGVLATAATILDLGGGAFERPDAFPVLRSIVIAAYVVVGGYSWWRRSGSSRFDLLLVGVGVSYAFVSLNASHVALVHTIGRILFAGFIVFLAYVFLCFPHGELESRRARGLIVGFSLTTCVVWLAALPLISRLPAAGPLSDCGSSCPDNAFQVANASDALSSALVWGINVVTVAGAVGLAVLLVAKTRSPARLRRRLVAPLLFCMALQALIYGAYSVSRQADLATSEPLKWVGVVAALMIPFALLVGQVRGRVFSATSLGHLVERAMGDGVTLAHLQALLRDALGDPLLTLATRDPQHGGYVGVNGEAVELPTDRHDLTVTSVLRDGRPVAVLIHDAALDEGGGITTGLAATSLMLLENRQLVEELRSSRARIVASAHLERLRLERNLHDGAQQRLFGIQIKLEAARAQVGADERLVRELDEVAADAAAAVEDLRVLARGLYPTVLRERGLPDALRSFARSVAIPVRIVDRGIGRCDASVEEAVYFCTLEAIQNTTKHGGTGVRASVTLERRGEGLEFTISDDGGGFDPGSEARGSGLVGMQDRIGAVGGTVEVRSEPGRGSSVRGVVPHCWSANGASG